MTTAGRRPVDDAISPLPREHFGEGLERLQERSGLTWRGLAARTGVNYRDATPLRRAEHSRWGSGRRAIVGLARELHSGYDLETGVDNDNHGHDGDGG